MGRIVSAVGVACHSISGDDALAHRVEQAMAEAIELALADGVSIEDSERLRAVMQEARARVRAAAGLPAD